MLRPKWARPVITLTIPLTPKSLYALTLLDWPLQTEPWYRGPGGGEGRKDRLGTGMQLKHIISAIRKAGVQILAHHLPDCHCEQLPESHDCF